MEMPADLRTCRPSGLGCWFSRGLLPAEKALKRPLPMWLRMASARMLRAELWDHLGDVLCRRWAVVHGEKLPVGLEDLHVQGFQRRLHSGLARRIDPLVAVSPAVGAGKTLGIWLPRVQNKNLAWVAVDWMDRKKPPRPARSSSCRTT